jgi:hypothetical protein
MPPSVKLENISESELSVESPAVLFLLKAPMANPASNGNAFFIKLASIPVTSDAWAATFLLTSLVPNIWPRIPFPSARELAAEIRSGLSRYF